MGDLVTFLRSYTFYPSELVRISNGLVPRFCTHKSYKNHINSESNVSQNNLYWTFIVSKTLY